jgi:anti-sigma-K factor RskA
MTEEHEIAAAEYVLGTLTGDERVAFVARLSAEPELRRAVRFWQDRLAPLDDTAAPEAPPPELWRRIERALPGDFAPPGPAPAGNVVELRRRLVRWRAGAIAAGALAAGLAAFLVIDRVALAPPPQAGRYIAVVDSGGHEPALIAAIDTNTGEIRIRSLAAETPAGRSLELWHVPEGEAPRSLGLLRPGAEAQTISDAAAGPLGGILAVSVEPEGGSPTDAPTGPVIYSGRLIPVE